MLLECIANNENGKDIVIEYYGEEVVNKLMNAVSKLL